MAVDVAHQVNQVIELGLDMMAKQSTIPGSLWDWIRMAEQVSISRRKEIRRTTPRSGNHGQPARHCLQNCHPETLGSQRVHVTIRRRASSPAPVRRHVHLQKETHHSGYILSPA
jgi:hypothetical protein